MSIIQRQHYSLKTNSEITDICQPLFQDYGLDHFAYLRYYFNSASLAVLITDAFLLEHHFRQCYRIIPIIPKQLLADKFHYIALPNQEDGFNQAVHDYQTIFNISYPIYLFECHLDYFELFIYAARGQSASIINFYFNYMDVLEKFKFYFKEKAKKLLQEAEKDKLLIPQTMQPHFMGLNNDSRLEINPRFVTKRYELNGKYGHVTLSKREVDTATYLVQGYTAKEVARIMNISPRTVESYIANVKLKLAIRKKSELITLFKQFNLF